MQHVEKKIKTTFDTPGGGVYIPIMATRTPHNTESKMATANNNPFTALYLLAKQTDERRNDGALKAQSAFWEILGIAADALFCDDLVVAAARDAVRDGAPLAEISDKANNALLDVYDATARTKGYKGHPPARNVEPMVYAPYNEVSWSRAASAVEHLAGGSQPHGNDGDVAVAYGLATKHYDDVSLNQYALTERGRQCAAAGLVGDWLSDMVLDEAPTPTRNECAGMLTTTYAAARGWDADLLLGDVFQAQEAGLVETTRPSMRLVVRPTDRGRQYVTAVLVMRAVRGLAAA